MAGKKAAGKAARPTYRWTIFRGTAPVQHYRSDGELRAAFRNDPQERQVLAAVSLVHGSRPAPADAAKHRAPQTKAGTPKREV